MLVKQRLIAIASVLLAGQITAQEARIELRSTVTGNQEQPKVMYIVPWQNAQSPTLSYQPLQSLAADVFEEVERAEFLRELHYRERIEASAQARP